MGDKKQISFEVTNTSDKVKEFHLFGYSQHLNSLNFGNDPHIRLDAIYVSYQHVLVESAFNPCKIEQIRLISSEKRNIEQVVKLVSEDGFGCSIAEPILFKSDVFKFQEDMTESRNQFKLDCNTTLHFKIQPNSSLSIYLWGESLGRVDYIQSHNPTLSQIAKLFFKKLFKLK